MAPVMNPMRADPALADLGTKLRELRSRDPMGQTVEPTADDLALFERWAVETFGQSVWDFYATETWDIGH